jgi:hypothetical protein
MLQHHSSVDQIVRILFQDTFVTHVLLADLEVGVVQLLDESRIDVDRDDRSIGSDACAQPLGNRPSASAYFEATPILEHTDGLQAPNCHWISPGFDGGKPLSGSHPGIVVNVVVAAGASRFRRPRHVCSPTVVARFAPYVRHLRSVVLPRGDERFASRTNCATCGSCKINVKGKTLLTTLARISSR